MDRHGITKGAIDDYFNDPDMSPYSEFNNFTSADSLREKMRLINDGIEADEWPIQALSIDSEVDGVESIEYTIFYHDIIKSLQFIIGHKGFEQDLVYNPVCQYASNSPMDPDVGDDDERLYGEMNTGDWWWNTQLSMVEESIDNATIIPVLLASDKTQLSTIADNLALWPVYLTIGNLNHETRKQHKRPNGLLLGLIPIHKGDDVDIKLEIYHTCLGVMTKRK